MLIDNARKLYDANNEDLMDRASGILFNVKPNGDWLSVRYQDTENNVALCDAWRLRRRSPTSTRRRCSRCKCGSFVPRVFASSVRMCWRDASASA